jgi:hypothetical protein
LGGFQIGDLGTEQREFVWWGECGRYGGDGGGRARRAFAECVRKVSEGRVKVVEEFSESGEAIKTDGVGPVGAEFVIDVADGHGPVKFDFVEIIDEGVGTVGDKEFDEAFVMMAKVEGCDGGVGEFGNGVDGLTESSEAIGEAVGGLGDVHGGDDGAEMLRGIEGVGDVVEKEI